MKLKRLLAVLLVFCLLPVYAYAEAPEKLSKPAPSLTNPALGVPFMLKIGNSSFALPMTGDFYPLELVDQNQFDSGIVHHYGSKTDNVEFYVREYISTCEEYIEYAKQSYTGMIGEPELADFTFDGIDVYFYSTEEKRDPENVYTVNIFFEEDGYTYEIEYWFTAEDADAQIDKIFGIVGGVERIELTRLCDSSYAFYCPGFDKVSYEPTEDIDVYEGIYGDDDEDLFINVYQYKNSNGYTLEQYAEACAEQDYGDLIAIPNDYTDIYAYYTYAQVDGEDCTLVNAFLLDGDNFVQISGFYKIDRTVYKFYRFLTSIQAIA